MKMLLSRALIVTCFSASPLSCSRAVSAPDASAGGVAAVSSSSIYEQLFRAQTAAESARDWSRVSSIKMQDFVNAVVAAAKASKNSAVAIDGLTFDSTLVSLEKSSAAWAGSPVTIGQLLSANGVTQASFGAGLDQGEFSSLVKELHSASSKPQTLGLTDGDAATETSPFLQRAATTAGKSAALYCGSAAVGLSSCGTAIGMAVAGVPILAMGAPVVLGAGLVASAGLSCRSVYTAGKFVVSETRNALKTPECQKATPTPQETRWGVDGSGGGDIETGLYHQSSPPSF